MATQISPAQTGSDSTTVGVIGAGTMGAGIALTALVAGFPVVLQDVSDSALSRAKEYIDGHLQRKGLGSRQERLRLVTDIGDLGGAEIVIEAVLEDLDLKREVFSALDRICPASAILATNTSTLPVSAIAAAVETPSRVAGMHFFNPAPVLPLVEIVRSPATSEDTLERLIAFAESLGKTAVVTGDTPGFIVNRVARPFYGEAVRMLAEGVAAVETIDRLAEAGAGFRMGPFRLMDLIGIDINLAAMRSLYEQTFGEPRYQPHRIQSALVAAGSLGRKTGRGFYSYEEQEEPQVLGAPAPLIPSDPGEIWLAPGGWAPGLASLCHEHGYAVTPPIPGNPPPRLAVLPAGGDERRLELLERVERILPDSTPILCQCADTSLSQVKEKARRPERLIGFDGLFLRSGSPISFARCGDTLEEAQHGVETFALSLGCWPVWVEDSPGLVLPRLISALVNEASFAVQEGVADPDTIDLAMRLGVSYPKGPLEWGGEIGLGKIVAVLDHLGEEFGEDRYRISSYLRRRARLEPRVRHPA